jgi:hypothetical protein
MSIVNIEVGQPETIRSEETQPEILLQGFTYFDRALLLPDLTNAIDNSGGWVLERRSVSSNSVEIIMEVQPDALPSIYGALLGTGIELTRDSHRTLAERCNCSLHMRPQRGISSVLVLRVEVRFLPDPPQPMDLSRLMIMGTAAA